MKRFEFPTNWNRKHGEQYLRNFLVDLLNKGQDDFNFTTFETCATNFHRDGCIVVFKKGEKVCNRKSKNILQVWSYGNSVPSVYIHGVTRFDSAYIAARQFVFDNCGI